jgi:hypothetical protein
MLLALSLTTELMLSTVPCEVPMTALDAWSRMLLALSLTTELTLSTVP